MKTTLRRLLISVTGLASLVTAAAGTDPVVQVGAGKDNAQPGIYYQLPRNYFRLHFQLKTATTHQGTFCDVARYFFELDTDWATKNCAKPGAKKTEVSLVPEISVDQLPEPDPNRWFHLVIGKGFATESNYTLNFGPGGTLSAFQSTVADHKVDIGIAILKVAASVVGQVLNPFKSALAAAEPVEGTPSATLTADCSAQLDAADRPLYAQLSKAEKDIACRIDAGFRTAYLHTPAELKPNVDEYVRDASAKDYRHLFSAVAVLREYLSILQDEPAFLHPDKLPKTGDSFTTVLNAREQMKKTILAEFLGSQEEKVDAVPDIVWKELSGGDVTLFAFTEDKGFCFVKPSEGVWFAREKSVDACEADKPRITVYAKLDGPSITEITPPTPTADSGFAYAVPSRTALRVYVKNDKGSFDYFQKDFDIPQFGEVRFLQTKLGNTSAYNVTLDPTTGALQGITVSVKPVLIAETVNSLGGVATSVLGAVQTANKKPSDLDQATAQRQLATEKLRIQLVANCQQDTTLSYCADLLK